MQQEQENAVVDWSKQKSDERFFLNVKIKYCSNHDDGDGRHTGSGSPKHTFHAESSLHNILELLAENEKKVQ